MPPTSRATVVLPVPGLPVKTRCRVIVGLFRPASPRSFSTRSSGDLPVDLALDPLQPDQVVELGEQLVEAALRRRRPVPARGSAAVRAFGCDVRTGGPRRPPAGAAARSEPRVVRAGVGGRADGGQLGGSGDGGVADDAHRRLAELAGRGGHLGQGLGVRPACGDRWAASVPRIAVGASRQRRPRLAASKKSWVDARPRRRAPSRPRPGARTRPRLRRATGPLARAACGVGAGGRWPAPPRRPPPRPGSPCAAGADGPLGRAHPASRPPGGCRRPSPPASAPRRLPRGGPRHRRQGRRSRRRAPRRSRPTPNFSARNRP